MGSRFLISPNYVRYGVSFITVMGNVLGAVLTFVYFAFVEAPLRDNSLSGASMAPGSERMELVVFIIGMAFIITPITLLARRLTGPIVADLDAKIRNWEPEGLNTIAGKILDLPLRMAGLSLLGWLLAALIFSFIPPAYRIYHKDMELAFRNFIGILLVGAPFTVIYIYFVLEWHLRRNLVELFPKSALREIPPSRRIRALPKITLVSLLISILPLAIISYLTLSQIEQIAAGKQNIESFVSHMPLVIVFLFFLGLGMALELSVLMSRSISDPLNMAVDAMERMGGGDLDAVAPALCNDEIGDIAEGFNKMAEGLQERDRIKETFGHYLSEAVVKEILKSPESVKLGGEVRYMTVLVSDLRGFTHMTETLGPEDTLEVINRHLGKMTEIIHDYEGAIDEIAGDGLLVFFGAPTIMPDHTLRAVKCALDMQNAMDSLNRENLEMGLPVLEMGIGINCGELVVGNIGSERRKKYGAMGTPINVAYRVESRTKGGEILVTSTVKERLGEKLVVESFRNVSLKGLDGEKTLFVVSGLNGDG